MRDKGVFKPAEVKATYDAVSGMLFRYDNRTFIGSPRTYGRDELCPTFFINDTDASELLVNLDLNGESATMTDVIVFNVINRSIGGVAVPLDYNTLAENFTMDVFDAYCVGFLLSERAFEMSFELLADFKKIHRRRKTVFVKLFTEDPKRFMSALYYANSRRVVAFIESTFMENSAQFGMTNRQKTYTRKQIKEAISFWTRVLENTSPVIDDLVGMFGYEAIFGGKKMRISVEIVNDIYDILNKNVFSNKLKKCPVAIDRNMQHIDKNVIMAYYYIAYTDSCEKPTKYFLLTQKGQDGAGNVFNPPTIYINPAVIYMPVISIASIVAHEMIHQDIVENGDGLVEQFNNDYRGIDYDIHGSEFQKRANEINVEFGLHVIVRGSELTYYDDSIKALKSFAKDSYWLNEGDNNEKYRGRIDCGNGYFKMWIA